MVGPAYPFPSGAYEIDYASALRDIHLRNPPEVKPLFGVLTPAQGVTEILPTPPIGYAWVLDPTFAYANPNASGGTATVTMRLGTAGDIVDQKQLAQSKLGNYGTSSSGTSMIGGLVAETSVTLEVTGGTSITYNGGAWLVSTLKARYWRSPQLTNAYQTVTLPSIPAGKALMPPHTSMGIVGSLQWQWCLNTDVTGRTVNLRITRGSNSIETEAGTTAAASARLALGCPPLPLLLPGDVLEAKLTASPAAAVYVGGALTVVDNYDA